VSSSNRGFVMRARVLRFWAFLLALVPLPGPDGSVAAHTAPRLPAAQSTPEKAPGKGMLLVAARKMRDPRFGGAVVLLVQHGEGGTVGLIINRPTDIRLSEVLPDIKGVDKARQPVFFGGPVATNAMLFMVRSGIPPKDAEHVGADVYVSGNRTALEKALTGNTPVKDLRVYAGYAGWAAGQLDAEIERGDWHLSPADAQTIFAKDPSTVWSELVGKDEPEGLMVEGGGPAQQEIRVGESPGGPRTTPAPVRCPFDGQFTIDARASRV
jgi:putative transcriptional regulator